MSETEMDKWLRELYGEEYWAQQKAERHFAIFQGKIRSIRDYRLSVNTIPENVFISFDMINEEVLEKAIHHAQQMPLVKILIRAASTYVHVVDIRGIV